MKLTRNAIGVMLKSDPHLVICEAVEDVEVEEGVADHVISDPTYDARTQSNARRGKESRRAISTEHVMGFAPSTSEKRLRWARWAAIATRRWVILFSDSESVADWKQAGERAGLVYVRCGAWVRTGDVEALEIGTKPKKSGAPQFTGDRPAAGHESLVIFHKGRRMRWNGGGRTAVYTAPVVRGEARRHETQKPESLMRDILRDFCDPGDIVCDPFTGSGTTQVAAKKLSMRSIGIEINPRHADYARRRIAAAQVA